MLELFIEGGALFMGILSLLLLAVLSMAVLNGTQILTDKVKDLDTKSHQLTYIKSVGLLSLVVGVLGQLIGLFQGFGSMAIVKNLSPSIIYSGIRVSMITTIFGMIIFLISYLLWLGLDYKFKKSSL